MAVSKTFTRSKSRFAEVRLTKDNNGAGNAVTIRLKPGSWVLRTEATVPKVFDGTGTVTVTSTDGTVTWWSAVTVKNAGIASATATTKKFYPNGGTITSYITDQNTDSSGGDVRVIYEIVEPGVVDEIVE